MALTVAPTSLFKATTCRFSCGPLCKASEKLIAQPVRQRDHCQRKQTYPSRLCLPRLKAEGPKQST